MEGEVGVEVKEEVDWREGLKEGSTNRPNKAFSFLKTRKEERNSAMTRSAHERPEGHRPSMNEVCPPLEKEKEVGESLGEKEKEGKRERK